MVMWPRLWGKQLETEWIQSSVGGSVELAEQTVLSIVIW